MEAVLNCKPEDLEDYYGLLGCDELSSVSSGSAFMLETDSDATGNTECVMQSS